MVFCNIKFILLLALFAACESWDLSHIGIKDFSLLHVSILRNHAYLSIQVNQCKNASGYSLVEATWPDTEIYAKGRPYPSAEWHQSGQCETLQNVIHTDVDLFGRIWILDKGNKEFTCPAKLIVYNTFSNQILHTFKFGTDNSINVASVKIDPTTLHWGQKAYVGVSNGNVMYICSTRSEKCTHIILSEEKQRKVINTGLISTENMAVSKSDNSLFITSPNSLSLFALPLDKIRKYEQKQSKRNGITKMTVKFLGEKLGPSHGLLVDSGHGLYYYLTRDFAIVRWDTRKPLKAESHDVLAQSYRLLPNVTDLISDLHGSVWAVTNPMYTQQRQAYSKMSKQKNKSNFITKEGKPLPSCVKIVN